MIKKLLLVSWRPKPQNIFGSSGHGLLHTSYYKPAFWVHTDDQKLNRQAAVSHIEGHALINLIIFYLAVFFFLIISSINHLFVCSSLLDLGHVFFSCEIRHDWDAAGDDAVSKQCSFSPLKLIKTNPELTSS